jgi:protease YdgD
MAAFGSVFRADDWPRASRLAIAAASLMFLAGAAAADTPPPLPKIGVTGSDNRVRVDSATWPWIAIGRINLEGRGHCTGTLVAPDLVLTAAHCLWNAPDGRWGIPLETHFVAGYDRGTYAAHSRGRAFILDPNYDPKRRLEVFGMARDWALVELEKKLDIRPVPLAQLDWPALYRLGQAGEMTNAGYSSDWPEIAMRDAGCRAEKIFAEQPLVLHDCDATFGASGGPLLRMRGDRIEVVGVQSGAIQLKASAEHPAGEELSAAVPVWQFIAAARR